MAMKQVWSCGGGRQSCAIAVLIIQGRLPKPDLSIIADTGREKKSTWNYYDRILHPELKKVGVELHRVKASEWGYAGDRVENSKGSLLIPAFTDQEGRMSKMTNFCSTYWKSDVCQRFTSSNGIMPAQNCSWLGYSLDEPKRYLKKKASEAYFMGRVRFPLVDDVPLRSEESVELVLDHGWPEPPRSSCFMCPNLRDAEWVEMRDNEPEDFEKAIQFDEELRFLDDHAWLHNSGKPLSEVVFKPNPADVQPCDSGHCFV